MQRLELFDDRYDFLILPAAAVVLIALFYGYPAAALAAVCVLIAAKFKPLRLSGGNESALTMAATGAVLAFSIFLRSFFFNQYCSTAHWAVNGRIYQDMHILMPCFIAGGYLQYALSGGWHGILRDLLMPAAGVILVYLALPPTQKLLGALGLSAALFIGLIINAPVLRVEPIDTATDDTPQQRVTAPLNSSDASKISEPLTPQRDAEGILTGDQAARAKEEQPPKKRPATIPASFVGEWNAILTDCGTDLNDSRVRVTPTRVIFYESEAEVTSVARNSPREIMFAGTYSGEGETWLDRASMQLSKAGDQLTIDGLKRYRCP